MTVSPKHMLDAAYSLELASRASLEAQVAALADDIAYDNHDIDDGLRSGFLELDELLELDFVAENFRSVERRYPGFRSHRAESVLEEFRLNLYSLLLSPWFALTRALEARMQ